MSRLRLPLLAAIAAIPSASVAQAPDDSGAATVVGGILTESTADGFWARFSGAVSEGARVSLYAHAGGDVVGAARVQWASATAPYDALLTAVRATGSIHSRGSAVTDYMRWTGEAPAWRSDTDLPIVAGYYAAAPMRRQARGGGDALSVLLAQLASRPEGGDLARRIGALRRGPSHWQSMCELISMAPTVRMSDPIARLLVRRIRDLAAAHGGVGGAVPANWFPIELSLEKSRDSGLAGSNAAR